MTMLEMPTGQVAVFETEEDVVTEAPKKRRTRAPSKRVLTIVERIVAEIQRLGEAELLTLYHQIGGNVSHSTVDRRLAQDDRVVRELRDHRIWYRSASGVPETVPEAEVSASEMLLAVEIYADHVRISLEDFRRMLEALS